MVPFKAIKNIFKRLGVVTIGKLFAFVTIPIISKALGPQNYGVYSLVVAISSYAFLPANWGFLAKGIRDVAKGGEEIYSTTMELLHAKYILWFLGGLVTLILSYLFYKDLQYLLFIFLAINTNLGVALSLDFYFYGKKNTSVPSIAYLVGQVFFLALVYFFINDSSDLVTLLAINVIVYLVEAFIIITYFRKEYVQFSFVSIMKFNLADMKKSINLLAKNFHIGFGSKINFIQTTYPILIIPVFLSTYDLGVFSAAFKVFAISNLLLQTINVVFSPWIVESKHKSRQKQYSLFLKMSVLYLTMGIIASLALYFSAPFITHKLFGAEFDQVEDLLKNFSLYLMPFWFLFMMLNMYMNNLELDKSFFKGAIYQLIIILILVPIFLYYQGIGGIVYALSIPVWMVSLYYLYLLRDIFLNKTNDAISI